MASIFTDHRGEIRDVLLEKIECVTLITFKEGAIRGNHYHKKTVQYDYVIDGELIVATPNDTWIVGKGDLVKHKKNVPHAYKALSNATIISMVRGLRKGEDYSKDTYKLDESLL